MPKPEQFKNFSANARAAKLDRAEKAALGLTKPAKKKAAPKKAKATAVAYKPAQKHVDARKAAIAAQREKDRKAIAAMKKKKS